MTNKSYTLKICKYLIVISFGNVIQYPLALARLYRCKIKYVKGMNIVYGVKK